MEKVKVDSSIDPALRNILSEYLMRHTCQLFEKVGEVYKPYGSGVLVEIHEVHFILTASHVADALTIETKDLFIRVDVEGYIKVLGEIKYTDIDQSSDIDLAYIKIDLGMVEPLSKPYIFLKIDKIRKHINLLDAMNYCVVGFLRRI